MTQKKLFNNLFLLLVITLVILPFMVTFNDFLTRTIQSIRLYDLIQSYIVPIEVKMVAVILKPLPINFKVAADGMVVNGVFAEVTWNCIGWQSLVLFFLSLLVGFQGHFTKVSKLEALAIGFLGTFIINLFRMAFIIILLAISQPLFAVVFHDYLAAIMTIVWLFGFWWFSYSYVLEERKN